MHLRAAFVLKAALTNFLLHQNSNLFTVTFGEKVTQLNLVITQDNFYCAGDKDQFQNWHIDIIDKVEGLNYCVGLLICSTKSTFETYLLRRLKWSEIGLATASGCIKFTLATASDKNSCTNKYIRSGHLKGFWQLPFTLATASELWQLLLWQLPLTLATASDYS